MPVPQSEIETTEHGDLPAGGGWYVINATKSRWWRHDHFGSACTFEGNERFTEYGINIHVLQPGQPNGLYHRESNQEDFLVISGRCILVIEGEKRELGQWDFAHCPAGTEHVLVGAGSEPCIIVMTGARNENEELVYPVSPVADEFSASAEQETDEAREAYKPFGRMAPGPYQGELDAFDV